MRKTIGMILMAAGAVLIIGGVAFLLAFNKPSGTAREHYEKGLREASAGNTMAAISEYSAAIELNQRYEVVYRKRAEAYRSKGDLFSSAKDYETLILGGSRKPEDFISLMSIYVQRGDQGRAFNLVDKVTKYNRKNPAMWQSIGDLYYRSGLYSEALEAYQNTAKLRPKSSQAYVSQARIYEILGDYDQAKSAFDAAVEARPFDALHPFIRGNYLTRRKEYRPAITDYETSLALKPSFYDAEIGIGRAYFLLGDYENALTAIAAAITDGPERFEAYRDRVDVYVALGKTDLAAADCRAALKRAKNRTDKSRITIKLQELLY